MTDVNEIFADYQAELDKLFEELRRKIEALLKKTKKIKHKPNNSKEMVNMKAKLISAAIGMLLEILGKYGGGIMKELADMVLDFVENRVLGSASTIDDKLVLPICDMIRSGFDIPDNDD